MEEAELKTEQVGIEELRPAEYNPRKWTDAARAQLTASLDEFGFVQPIVATSAPARKGIIIGGNFKLDIAKSKGLKTVPVVWVNIPDIKKEKELNLRLNKNQGDFDYELLAGFDLALLEEVGFDEEELNEILGSNDEKKYKKTITFRVTDEQAEFIRAALEKANDDPLLIQSGKRPKQSDALMVIMKQWKEKRS